MFEKKMSDTDKKRLAKEAKKKERAEKKSGGSAKGSRVVAALKTLLVPALFAGIVCMLIYMAMENKAAEAELKGQVVVAREDIAANTIVKPEEVSKYFEVISVDRSAISDSSYGKIGELPTESFYIKRAMKKSQMVYKDDVVTTDAILDKYKNGFEVTSFATESFDGGVNGSLRKGDVVDVYALDPATESLVLMAENVYISEVYDSAGNKISAPEEIATAFTVFVTPEEVENINLAVVYGKIQMYLKTE